MASNDRRRDEDDGATVSGELVQHDSMAAVLSRAEIDQQVATAKSYPRSVKRFLAEALDLATMTEQVAEDCMYALPRDGKTIEGPSARFAEIIASSWGNCRAGGRIVAEDGEFITAQGVFHDLEKNTAITYEVQRRITDRNGRRYKPDMIGVTGNAAASIALRNAVLKGVPKAIWQQVYDAARKCAIGDVKSLVSRRDRALEHFGKMGIQPDRICAVLGVDGVEDIGLEELAKLTGIKTSLKDGDTTLEQVFAPPKPPPETARTTKPSEKPHAGKAGTLKLEPTDPDGVDPEREKLLAQLMDKCTEMAGDDPSMIARIEQQYRKAAGVAESGDLSLGDLRAITSRFEA